MTSEAEKAVLLIEDDISVAAYIKGVVETFFPVTVLHAASADLARTLFRANVETIVAIVSDLSLPGIEGVSLVKELAERHLEIGVLFVTGQVETESNLSKAVGRDVSLMMKPFGPVELKVALEKHLMRGTPAYELIR